jgi:hypothetical protein
MSQRTFTQFKSNECQTHLNRASISLSFASLRPPAANYEELVKMNIPSSGPERDFALALREHFQTIVGREVS